MVGVSKGPQGQHARTKQHGRSTTEFECYLSRASEGKARRMGSCTYHFGTKEPQPVLKEGRMNRVLIYPGVRSLVIAYTVNLRWLSGFQPTASRTYACPTARLLRVWRRLQCDGCDCITQGR
jgi:hypothetical protein